MNDHNEWGEWSAGTKNRTCLCSFLRNTALGRIDCFCARISTGLLQPSACVTAVGCLIGCYESGIYR